MVDSDVDEAYNLADDDNDYEALGHEQRLKAAIHYTVGLICNEIGQPQNITFTVQFIAVLSEIIFKQAQQYADDLESFTKHAKRTTISVDDVKLLVRRNAKLREHITEMIEEMKPMKRDNGKGSKSKKKRLNVESDENDDDLE